MASSKVETEKGEQRELKHLGSVKLIALNAVVFVSHLYDYAKQNSGPLKSTVGTIENAVATVVGPVYERFKGLPDDVLVFLDGKVDEVVHKFDKSAQPVAKKVATEAQTVLQKATNLAKNFAQEVQASGPRAAVSHAGALYKQFAVKQIAVVWYKLNHVPHLHGIAEMAVPTATYWSDKYNQIVSDLSAKGYTVFAYVPLVPVEEIAKAYKQVEAGAAKKDDDGAGSNSSWSDSD